MSRYFIKEISASGPGKHLSTISFEDGVNIIHGPSNTGKSYVINCINFMFAGDKVPFTKGETGYDTVSMLMESTDGDAISLQRRIVDGKKGERGESYVTVTCSNMAAPRKFRISNLEYSDFLLKLFGIEKRHQIIGLQNMDPQNLSIRTIFHFAFLDEGHILSERTALDTPEHSKITASQTSLYFLMTGDDLNNIIPKEDSKQRELNAAHREGVLIYINQKINELSQKKQELEQKLAAHKDVDLDSRIDQIVAEIESVNQQIRDLSGKSEVLLRQIYSLSEKLQEAMFLKDRYRALRSQYSADIKRLRFIVDGEQKRGKKIVVARCPFCDQKMPEAASGDESYQEAARVELEKTVSQLSDLKEVEGRLDDRIEGFKARLKELNAQNNAITETINSQLHPKAEELKELFDSYNEVMKIKNWMEEMDAAADSYSSDIQDQNGEGDEEVKFHPLDKFPKEIWEKWNEIYDAAVKGCGYPGAMKAYIDPDIFDSRVNGKAKGFEGKGYRAYLNTIVLFSLMKYLEEYGTYRLGFLVLDSPILSLKERKKVLTVEEHALPGMKASLFQYVIDNCGDNQIIIAENEIPEEVNYTSANLIEFTETDDGTYGFLADVRNSEATN